MSTLVLKDALHRLVIETNDDTILQQVQSFFLSIKEKIIPQTGGLLLVKKH